MDAKHVPQLQHMVPYPQINDALDEGKGAKGDELARDVVAGTEIVIPLTVQHGAITDDFVCTVREAQEHGHHQREEEVGGYVEGRGEGVAVFF
jgi:hypothetical protein